MIRSWLERVDVGHAARSAHDSTILDHVPNEVVASQETNRLPRFFQCVTLLDYGSCACSACLPDLAPYFEGYRQQRRWDDCHSKREHVYP